MRKRRYTINTVKKYILIAGLFELKLQRELIVLPDIVQALVFNGSNDALLITFRLLYLHMQLFPTKHSTLIKF